MDGDVVVPSNLNRQLIALTSTVGQNKARVMAARAADIDPGTEIKVLPRFYTEDDSLDLTQYDWIIDAIDDVSAKTELIVKASELGVNIISAMGAGGKTGTAETHPRKLNQWVVSFLGFAPAEDPQICIYVVLDRINNKKQDEAGRSCILARKILTELLPYMNIYMTEPLTPEETLELEQLGLYDTNEPVSAEGESEDTQ